MNTFGERLRFIMLLRGASIAEVAKACEVSTVAVGFWLKMNTARLSGEHLLKAAAFLRIRPSWLAFGGGKWIPHPENTHITLQ